MSGPVLFTVTEAIGPEADMSEIPVLNATPKLVDLPEGLDVLELDGSTKRLENTTTRAGVLSPFASRTPSGTGTRAIVWTRPDPDPDLLLSAYTSQCQNVRDVPSSGGGDVDAALEDRDAQWVDALTLDWPVKP